jgi:hypothetical protein
MGVARSTSPHRSPGKGWGRVSPSAADRSYYRHARFGDVWRADTRRWQFAASNGVRGHARTMRAAMVFCEAEATKA